MHMQHTLFEIQNLRQEIEEIEKELGGLPEGYLVRKGSNYYHKLEGREKGITKDKGLVRQLARKAYLLSRQKQLKSTLTAGQIFMKHYALISPEDSIKALSKSYKTLPAEYFLQRPEDDWATRPYEKNEAFPEGLKILTSSGIYVRSKSELIIANALDMKKIPYRYEAKIILSGQTKYPDFTIRRPSDNKIILWEHFGKMDDSNYVQDMYSKLELYADNGFLPFDNFIFTFERDIISGKRIYDLIDRIILI